MATKRAKAIAEAKHISTPIIYGLCDLRDGVVVYVGQAKNAQSRFDAYRGARSHNERLNAWLSHPERQLGFYALEASPLDMNAAERRWIAEFPALFNVSAGGVEAWMRHTSQPWMAGTGVGCPSSILLHHIKTNTDVPLPADFQERINDARKRMSIKERCLCELDLCRSVLMQRSCWQRRAEQWLDVVSDKLIAALEGGANGEANKIHPCPS